jgi:hypothetical protein
MTVAWSAIRKAIRTFLPVTAPAGHMNFREELFLE